MKRLIACIAILMLVSSAYGTATSITIYGTNKSNAQTNVTCHGCNNTISVQAWNTSYVKNISVHSRNGSGGDVVSFNISNVTGYQVQELKVNGTSINAYQAGANGMLNFTYTVVGNRTLVLSPAMNANGYNFTWGYFQAIKQIGTADSSFAGNIIMNRSSGNMLMRLQVPATQLIDMIWGDHVTANQAALTWNAATQTFLVRTLGTDRIGFGTEDSEDMTIIAGGNVGIGTTTPATRLDVNGIISGNGSGLSGLNASNITRPSAVTNRTGTYAVNTVYQNTGSTPIMVAITTDESGLSRSLKADSSNPPTTVIGYVDADIPAYAISMVGIVYVNQYYTLTGTAPTINLWLEWGI